MEYTWFMSASMAVWLGIGAYVVFLGRVQTSLQKRLRQWEVLHGNPADIQGER